MNGRPAWYRRARVWLFVAGTVVVTGSLLNAEPARAQAGTDRGPWPTLVAPTTRQKAPDSDGFLQRWLILEPIPVGAELNDSAVRATVAREYFPGQLTVVPEDGDTVDVDGSLDDETLRWHAVDTVNYNVNLYHFAYALGKPTSNVLFWIVTVVDSPREMRDIRLAIGSNAASIWWVNGEEVIGIYNDRQTVIDDGVSKRITLEAGRNVIRAAVINAGGATDFCARLLDAEAEPIRDLSVNLSL